MATDEALARAFATSNASAALTDIDSDAHGRRWLALQRKDREWDAYDRNILPMSAKTCAVVMGDEVTGGLGVETQEHSGRQFVDRLGRTFDVYESAMPPPDKDYSHLRSSHRQLERCQGRATRPKTEVVGVTNSTDLGGVDSTAERTAQLQVKRRAVFFNQAGTQDAPAFDTGRGTYDGYNPKWSNEARVHAVEPTWRSTVQTQTPLRRATNVLYRAFESLAETRRKETGPVFAHPAAGEPVSARRAVTSLPIINEATLRAGATLTSLAIGKQGIESRRPDDDADREMPDDQANDAVYASSGSVPAAPMDHAVVGDGDRAVGVDDATCDAPIFVTTVPAEATASEDRDTHNVVRPRASVDHARARQVAHELTRPLGADDLEVADILRVEESASAAPVHGVERTNLTRTLPADNKGAREKSASAAPVHGVERTNLTRTLPADNKGAREKSALAAPVRGVERTNLTRTLPTDNKGAREALEEARAIDPPVFLGSGDASAVDRCVADDALRAPRVVEHVHLDATQRPSLCILSNPHDLKAPPISSVELHDTQRSYLVRQVPTRALYETRKVEALATPALEAEMPTYTRTNAGSAIANGILLSSNPHRHEPARATTAAVPTRGSGMAGSTASTNRARPTAPHRLEPSRATSAVAPTRSGGLTMEGMRPCAQVSETRFGGLQTVDRMGNFGGDSIARPDSRTDHAHDRTHLLNLSVSGRSTPLQTARVAAQVQQSGLRG